jgi:hypothetical protein
MFGFWNWNDEKQLKKLEEKKNNTLNMIAYYETEIKNMKTKNKRESFPNEEQYNNYLNKLKDGLLKQHDKLIKIAKDIDFIKNKQNN